jgi:aspartate kinase
MLIIQKFGGTSVGTLERIENVAGRVEKSAQAGYSIVVVVSAMSGDTNKLIDYCNHFGKSPNKMAMDFVVSSGERVTAGLLAIALESKGLKAIAMSGRQAGIKTDSAHTTARIDTIDPHTMQERLASGYIIVVSGFQGITDDGVVTTLGRGGSDLTAVALAGALKADVCEIYTDVDGVYTTDPRIEPKARKLDVISYDEMLELASAGAKVLQNRSVELAKKLNVNIVTRSSFNDNEGTLITKENNMMEDVLVSGIALDKNQVIVDVNDLEDKPGIAADIFKALSDENIVVDMIVQNISHDAKANISFTVPQSELDGCRVVMSKFEARGAKISYNLDVSKVSVVGVGMKSHSGVASKAFTTLAAESINVLMISTSEIKISIVIKEKYGELAVRALHEAYGLDK